jgi:integrase
MIDTTQVREKKKKTPRDRHTGSIFRQPGTMNFTIQYYVHGRRVRESTGTDDKQIAQSKLTARLAQIDRGEPVILARRKPLLVSELYDALEAEYIRNGRRSLKALKTRWKHLKPVFENRSAASIDKEAIEAYIDSRLTEGAARASINRELAALKKMFRAKADKLPKLPVFPSKLDKEKIRSGFIGDEGFAALIAHAHSLWLRTFLEIAYTWGWRCTEILTRRLRHIDLSDRTIRLEAQETKSGKPRTCTMTQRIYDLAKECVHGKDPEDFLLTRAGNRPIRDFRKCWGTLTAVAGLSGLLVHDLRRSACRNLRRAGCSENTIMAIGGWETPSVFKRYDIHDNKDKELALAALEKKRGADFGHSLGHSPASNDENGPGVRRELVQ